MSRITTLKNDELVPEIVPDISDNVSRIRDFSRTVEPENWELFLINKGDLLRKGDFCSVQEARMTLYLIFSSLHWSMESLDEDREFRQQVEKALIYIKGYTKGIVSR